MVKQWDCQAAEKWGPERGADIKLSKSTLAPQAPRDLFVPARLHSLKIRQHPAWCHRLGLCVQNMNISGHFMRRNTLGRFASAHSSGAIHHGGKTTAAGAGSWLYPACSQLTSSIFSCSGSKSRERCLSQGQVFPSQLT